jgi:hypothetical protein
MLKSSNLQKYLRTHAEPEALLSPPSGANYGFAIVVPACGETHEFITLWERSMGAKAGSPPLVVVVVNADSHTSTQYNHTNAQLVADVLSRPHQLLQGSCPAYLVEYARFDLLLVDRSAAPHLLPGTGGVGLARKVGCDIICAWYTRGVITQPWWLSTDADVELPIDLRRQLYALSPLGGITCLPFEHVASGNSRVDAATFAVEVELRYHALGLAFAKSNYAWPALGSCLAIHPNIYAAVRGFPKRQAGEDHYLLQKASKLAPILFGDGSPVRIRARRSARTPFGTGRSVDRLLAREPLTLSLRNPECYVWLGRIIAWLDVLGSSGDWPQFHDQLRHGERFEVPVVAVLDRIGALAAWQTTSARQLPAQTRKRRLYDWFDGLRQIQFLRGLEVVLPRQGAIEALAAAPFTRDVIDDEIDSVSEGTWFTLAQRLRRFPISQSPFGV